MPRAGASARRSRSIRCGSSCGGHHGLPDAHGGPDHGDLLQSPLHEQRHLVRQNRAIVPETNGRVAQVYVDGVSDEVKQGAPIFRMDSSTQEAAAEAARRKIAEVEAAMVAARTDVMAVRESLDRSPLAPDG
jgi:hypothetical protein